MKIGAIIVNYNDSKRIVLLVNKLLAYSVFSDIVIVDNVSNEEDINNLKNQLTQYQVHILINETNVGFNQATTNGLKLLSDMKNDYAFSINSDIEVSKETIIAHVSFLEEHNDYGAVSCKMIEGGKEKQMYYQFPTIGSEVRNDLGINKLFHIKPKIRKKHDGYIDIDFARSSFLCLRMEAMEKIDYFDGGTFLYFGEAILGIKLKKLGYKEACLLNYKYYHNHIYKKGYKMNGYKATYKDSLYLFNRYYRVSKFGFFRLKTAYKIGILIRKVFRIS